jgi:hypothetical protein
MKTKTATVNRLVAANDAGLVYRTEVGAEHSAA